MVHDLKPVVRIIPLGGLGEIGKNMMAVECGDDIIVVDCGVQFPDEDMLGVDLIIPDINYLREREDKVRAILITHGHEDHIGALPFILPQLDVPVYAPGLAHGLISAKLKGRRGTRDATTYAIEPDTAYQFGQAFTVTWFRVCHSIPDAMGLVIETPIGPIIHTGDFKIDHTPVDGRKMDLATLARYGAQGVTLLLSDSTYAEVPGYTPSEQVVGEALERAIGDAPGRVMVATFASLISRVQQVVDAAVRHDRHVSIVGRSMVESVNVAEEMGYLTLPPGTMVSLGESRRLPPEKVVLMTTGSQGEPTSALVRIANKDHREVQIMTGDTVIISATPIPGNEKAVSRTIDNLLRQGAKVLYDRVATVHVHGHASQEELKMVLSLVRPKFFVPVHGEYRHLMAHAKLAWDLGIAEEGIFVMEDGDVLELSEDSAQVVEQITAGPIFIDGLTTHDNTSEVLRQRKTLSKDGVVVIVLPAQNGGDGKGKGQPLAAPPPLVAPQPSGVPKIVSSGFMNDSDTGGLFQELIEELQKILASDPVFREEPELAKSKVRETARDFIAKSTHRRPMIIPVVLES